MRWILAILIFFLSFTAAAQFNCSNSLLYGPSFRSSNMYYFQQQFYNPAYAGTVHQPTWWMSSQFNDEPNGSGKTLNLSWQGQFPDYRSNLGVIFNYADFNEVDSGSTPNSEDFKQWQLGIQHNYSFDIGAGEARAAIAVSLLRYRDIFSGNGAGQINEYKYRPNVDLGFLGVFGNFELGVGMQHSNEPNFRDNSSGATSAHFRRIGYMQASYEIQLSEAIFLKPSTMVRQLIGQSTRNSCGISTDVSMLFNYKDTFFAGYSWRWHKERYPHSVLLAYRMDNGFQLTGALDLPAGNSGDRYRFEIGLGLFLFQYEQPVEPEEGL